MREPGEIERRTQNRALRLLREELHYEYLGNWIDRPDNQNIEESLAQRWLRETAGYDEVLVNGALFQLNRAAGDTSRSLYDRNRDVYQLLRYGAKVTPEAGEESETVWLIDWEHPDRNHFAVAEEVTVAGAGVGAYTKRPDLVLYVNGIAVAVLELKRSTVSVNEGIRQNIDSQRHEFIEHFFSTIQLVMAGNDTEGLRYGVIGTPEKYFLTWKEDGPATNPLDRPLLQMLRKDRLLELIHDFMLFDAGVKKVCRPHQYFGVRRAQPFVERHEGGIIWHAQGSGKSLTMVWLAKWIREHVTDARLLLITDRVELDEQIERVFKGVDEHIYRAKSGADLVAKLNAAEPWLLCSLVHKFGGKDGDDSIDVPEYIEELRRAVSAGFRAKGTLFVFVDECHRTQSGDLHEAMKALLPDATFIGFTGTPLLRTDKKRTIEVFGRYIDTYKFNEAVADGVILDLRYEARDIDQSLSSQAKIDAWFEAKTKNLSDLGKAQLKQRWGTLQELFSSQSRLDKIVGDMLLDMEQRDRLASGLGNALLVCDSIYEACKVYELFAQKGLRGKCAIVTSYRPTASALKGEDSGEGETERLHEFSVYRHMLADWFGEPSEVAITKTDLFEKKVKELFIHEPGQMKLLIVVDKLLTGFDAPPATYLYIDKQMRDHGLFQAICRVNRLDTDDKEYGYIIDYKDLFRELQGAVRDYTSGAFDTYDAEDVSGLLKNRLDEARDRLEQARETVKGVCEPVAPPRDAEAYLRHFCASELGNAEQLKANEPVRLVLYQAVASLIRSYANLAPEMTAAGYADDQIATIRDEVDRFEKVRTEVKLASGDYVDLKMFEPAMRHLLDTYVRAEDSRQLSAFDDISLINLVVERGRDGLDQLPDTLRNHREAAAEAIVNNVRKLIVDNEPINPRYYERMSELLDDLLEARRRAAMSYERYLEEILRFARDVYTGPSAAAYPPALDTDAKRALYDNLGNDEAGALRVESAIRASLQDGWRNNPMKTRRVQIGIRDALEHDKGEDPGEVQRILTLITSRDDY
ncbi:MAG: HsdR family type I site-specific deoxyribonuclease [Isosphaeraceae bacterium]|nr:HsdR family type I site-specific deoxyribonuclease [Isosphaeraceae bacterium]